MSIRLKIEHVPLGDPSLLLGAITQIEQKRCQTSLCDVVVLEQLTECGIPQRSRQASPQCLPRPWVVAQPQVTPDYVLQQPYRLTFDNLRDHVAQHGSHCIEPFVGLADVSQPHVVQQDLLDDKDGDCFGKFGTGFHDSKAKRDDLGGEKEGDHIRIVILLDQSTNHTERSKTQILERPCLGRRVEERVEEQRDMCLQEQSPCLAVTRYALKQSQSVANAVARLGGQCRRRKQRIHADNFLEERRHDTKAVPEDKSKVFVLFTLLAELEQGMFTLCGRSGQVVAIAEWLGGVAVTIATRVTAAAVFGCCCGIVGCTSGWRR